MRFFSSIHKSAAIGTALLIGSVLGAAGTGIAATVLGSSVFDDVERGSFYDEAIGELYADGIIKGYDGTDRFGPNDTVTRGQVAVMLKRFRDDLNGGDSDDDDSSSSRSRSSSSTSSSSSSSSSYNPKGSFRFTTGTFSINENQSSMTISVVRIGGNDGSATVKYAVTGGSASEGSDFTASTGTLEFANNETSKTFTIQLKDDSASEGSETVNVSLNTPTNGATIGTPSSAVITILDNESSSGSSSSASSGNSSSVNSNGTISFGASTYMANESDGTITITVRREGGTQGSVGVNYATSNGSATGNDYNSANGTLTFASGETAKTFTVGIVDDSSLEGGKTFNLTLSGPTGGANLGTSSASVTIFDNENTSATYSTGSLKFSKSAYDVTESDLKVNVVVQRTGGAKGQVSVNYATTSGTAVAGTDYGAVNGTLTFEAGETSKTIVISIVKDNSSEGEDTFYVDLSNPTGHAELISPSNATVTIE